jgi:hypothetical protein
MRRLFASSILLFATLAPCLAQAATPDAKQLAEIREPAGWSVREVGVGVELRQRRFEKLFTGPQCLTTLTIAADAKSVRFDVEAPGKLTRTSAMGKQLGALAAINGGFFEPDASPRGLLKLDGKLANPANANQGSIGVDDKGRLAIEKRAEGDWPQMREALGAGVVLVQDGKVVDHGKRQRSIRHPRSAIGAKKDGSLVLLAIDGRAKEAAGTSYEETATILVALGCEFAINLDGGGSTTLWTAGQGVCNFPCDNKTFDHAGERAVANALLLFATPVVEVDDDEAQLFGSGFAQRTDGKGLRGVDCTVWTSEGESAPPMVVFVARLPRAGKWTAHVWLPEIPESKLAFRAAAAVGGELPRLDGPLHTGKPGSWVEIGVVETKGEERATITIAEARGMPFVADAVKFVAVE